MTVRVSVAQERRTAAMPKRTERRTRRLRLLAGVRRDVASDSPGQVGFISLRARAARVSGLTVLLTFEVVGLKRFVRACQSDAWERSVQLPLTRPSDTLSPTGELEIGC
jgi:hypothetical protein